MRILLLICLITTSISFSETVTLGGSGIREDWIAEWEKATVILIGGSNPENATTGETVETPTRRAHATGFIVQLDTLNLPPLLITCKHVAEDLSENYDAIHVLLYDSDADSIFREGCFYLPLNSGTAASYWTTRPYDIAAFVLDTNRVIQSRSVIDLLNPFDFTSIRTSMHLRQGDGVAILGYPSSILNIAPWSERPLLRMGNISWISNDLSNSVLTYLIDIPSYPGFSGSPVIFTHEFTPNQINPEPVAFAGIQVSALAYLDSAKGLQGNTGLTFVVPSEIVIMLCNRVYSTISAIQSFRSISYANQ